MSISGGEFYLFWNYSIFGNCSFIYKGWFMREGAFAFPSMQLGQFNYSVYILAKS